MNKFKEIWFIYRNKVFLGAVICVVSIIAFFAVYYFNVEKTTANSIEFKSNKEEIEQFDNKVDDSENQLFEVVKVDIKGEVKKPGVYELESSKRINDVIKLAGGLTNNADTSVTNLSKKITDEMVIIIYSKKDVESFTIAKKTEEEKSIKCKNNEKLVNDSCVSSDSTSKNTSTSNKNILVNINTASVEELMTISGIGESKAKAIVEYRTRNGKFQKIEQIKDVSGIGESLFEKIKSNITI